MNNRGYLALRVKLGMQEFQHAVITVSQDHVLIGIHPFRQEEAMTRYYDGKLVVTPVGFTPDDPSQDVQVGDVVTIWQMNPYDLKENQKQDNTRVFKLEK